MIFDNKAACEYWLECLYKLDGADKLIGDDISAVVDMAGVYETGLSPIDFGAEIQLNGKCGIDLSVQYAVSDFWQSNPLKHRLVSSAGDFLHEYTRHLYEKDFAHLINSTYAYLEADTSKGDTGSPAIFLNLSGKAAEEMLPFILEKQQQTERIKAIKKLLKLVGKKMVPYYFGFMHSREELPLRLSFYVRENAGVKGMFSVLEKFCIEPGVASEQLPAIDELKLFSYMFDVDVLPDGTVGSTWGVELTPNAALPMHQYRMTGEESFDKLMGMLKKWGMADERIDLLPQCLWNRLYRDKYSGNYVMFSHLSHLKLRWKNGEAYPAKVYLQLREVPKQSTVNESIRMCFSQ